MINKNIIFNKYAISSVLLITLIILYILYRKRRNNYLSVLIQNSQNAKLLKNIDNQQFIKKNDRGLSWTLNFWVYINDWNYKYNSIKHIFVWDNCSAWLAKNKNSLVIHIPTYNNKTGSKTIVENIPLQKWTNIIILLNNRVLDIFVNGKLNNSKYLPNIPKNDRKLGMKITPYGGFNGNISKFYYYTFPIKKYDILGFHNVYSIFKQGSSGYLDRLF
jgi:hypothetical protein